MNRLSIKPKQTLLGSLAGAGLYVGVTMGSVYVYAKVVERMARSAER